ncbi:aminotransferase [Dioszegia hungarica]|uniref:Aminotransferase n=1 Tax=Dioszegia hungarica TaxID=4972 RepID=A0AA38HEE2_9TREE|nr:aminotransferase [Dioszegia hungarica]KAI9639153.1 aminotransferase [Dioszegia hungarica]
MVAATHAVVPDTRNASILIGMRDGMSGEFRLVPREQATVSVFDSAFMLGDGIWEGIRSKQGVIQFAKDHLNRLFESAKAMYMDLGCTRAELLDMIHQTTDANDMQTSDDVHIRLMVSRGLKRTPHQNPASTIGLPLIVIIAEHKRPDPSISERGLKLMTVHVRRGNPDVKDEMWNHMSKATDIQACIQSNAMGADEALMLDDRGYVKTCNSTNFMIVREGLDDDAGKLVIWSPTKNNQMQGITRRRTIAVCRAAGIKVIEQDFSLTEAYGAIEAFCCGTFPAQISVTHVDGRQIGDGVSPGPMVSHINKLYAEHVKADIQRGREAVVTEVREADLSWAKRIGAGFGGLWVPVANGEH